MYSMATIWVNDRIFLVEKLSELLIKTDKSGQWRSLYPGLNVSISN